MAVAVAIIFFGVFLLVIGLIIFFGSQYARKRKALSKSFASKENVRQSQHFNNSMDTPNKNTPLLKNEDHLEENQTQHENIFPDQDGSSDDLQDDYSESVNDNPTLSGPPANHRSNIPPPPVNE